MLKSDLCSMSFKFKFPEKTEEEFKAWINSYIGKKEGVFRRGNGGKPLEERRQALRQYMQEVVAPMNIFREIDVELIPALLKRDDYIVIRTDKDTSMGLGMDVGIVGIQGKHDDYGKVTFGADIYTSTFEGVAERLFEDLLPKGYRDNRARSNEPLDKMTGDFSVRGMSGWCSRLKEINVVGGATPSYISLVNQTLDKIKCLLTEKGLELLITSEENE